MDPDTARGALNIGCDDLLGHLGAVQCEVMGKTMPSGGPG